MGRIDSDGHAASAERERPGGATRSVRCELCAPRASADELGQALKRVLEIDPEHCPLCGAELKIIAAILAAPVIERILEYLGLSARGLVGGANSKFRLPSR